MKPRPYQERVISKTLAAFETYNTVLDVVPTGGGKTCIFAWLAQHFQPGRTLILAHREELIDQAIAKIKSTTGIWAQKEKAEFKASLHAPIVVASVQSMIRRLGKWPQDHFELVVADEAHHAISDSWQTVLNHFRAGGAKVLGVTATPDRSDKKDLGVFFETIGDEINLIELQEAGYLSKIFAQTIPLSIDLKGVGQSKGDFDENDLSDALTPYLGAIAREIAVHAPFRKKLAFLPLRATSKAFVDECRKIGIAALHVDGESEDRSEILKRFERNEFELLSNAMLLTEGYDCPDIDCIINLRVTKSRALYSQIVGRGTRIASWKENLLLLDFLWSHEKHNLIRPAHLIAGDEELAKAITEKLEKQAGGPVQEALDLDILNSDARAQREERLKQELEANAKKKSKLIDPVEFCLSLHNLEAAEFQPTMDWHSRPVSPQQAIALSNYGIDPSGIKNSGHASQIMELIHDRRDMGFASPKQVKLLKQLKHPKPETATFDEASRYLDARFKKPKQQEIAA